MEVIVSVEEAKKMGIELKNQKEISFEFVGRQIKSGIIFAQMGGKILEIPPEVKKTIRKTGD